MNIRYITLSSSYAIQRDIASVVHAMFKKRYLTHGSCAEMLKYELQK